MGRGRPAEARAPGPKTRSDKPIRRALGPRPLVVAILLAGFFLRVWDLETVPPGFHVDEAYNLLDARAILAGWRPVFLPDNAGREVLYSYLQASMMAGIGATPWVARLTSAFIGTATLALVYVLARRQTWTWASRRFAGVLPMAFVALSYWHLHFSRFGIRAILFPAVASLALWAWWRAFARLTSDETAIRRPSLGAAASAAWRGAGAHVGILALALATAWYTHPAGRILALVPLLHASWYLITTWRQGRSDASPLKAAAAAGLLSLAGVVPVAAYWLANPWAFGGHLQEVSIVGQGFKALIDSFGRTLLMFTVQGDSAPWRNLPGQPVFAALGFMALGGFAACLLVAWRGSQYSRLLVVALAVLMLPTALATDAPNFSRAIGLIPGIYVVGAMLFDAAIFGNLRARWLGPASAWFALAAVLTVAVLFLPLDYFSRWAHGEQTATAVDDDKVALARYADAEEDAGRYVYLSHDVASVHQAGMVEHATVRALSRHAPRGFDPHLGVVLPPSGTTGAYVLIDSEDGPTGAWHEGAVTESLSADALLTGNLVTALRAQWSELGAALSPGGGRLAMETSGGELAPACAMVKGFGVSAFPHHFFRCDLQSVPLRTRLTDPTSRVQTNGDAGGFIDHPTWDGSVRLVWGKVPGRMEPGDEVPITLAWECLKPMTADYSTAVQLVTPDGATGLGNGDGPPIGGSFPTSVWRVGELIVSEYSLTVAKDARPGPAVLQLGWYDLERVGDPAGSLYAPGGRQMAPVVEVTVAADN